MYHPIRMAMAAERQLADVRREAGVGMARQIRDLLALRRVAGMSRVEFYRYRLWRRELSPPARLQFTTLRERRATEWLRNPDPYRAWLHLKSPGARRIAATGVPVPEHLAVIGETDTAATPGVARIRDRDALRDLLGDTPATGVVIKPEDGMQGLGVLVAVSASRRGITLVSGEELSVDEIWRRIAATPPRVWRLEARVAAHPAVANYRPGTTPTVRMVSLLLGGKAMVQVATIKIPRGDSGVDNFHAGNLAAAVDLGTGVIGLGVNQGGTERHERHPESHLPIAGIRIPDWSSYIAAIETAAPALAPLTSLGWDVAVGPSGPVVLEANTSWDEDIVQVPQDRGILHGSYLDLLRQVGAGGMLDRRTAECPGWEAA